MIKPTLSMCAAVAALVWAAPAAANRTLEEPGSIRAIPRMVPKAKISDGLKAARLTDDCESQINSRDLVGLRCRLAVYNNLNRDEAITDPLAVERQRDAAQNAIKTAQSIATYSPVKKKKGHGENKYLAHKAACQVALDVHDRLNKLPAGTPASVAAAADKALRGDGGLFQAACECARDTVVLAQPLDLSESEKGALQSALTSRGCFLDKSKIATKRGGPSSSFEGEASAIAAQNTADAMFKDYAKARDVGLKRCRQKWVGPARVKDKKKAESCVCTEIKRWRFPKERGRPDTTVKLDVAPKLTVDVVVAANGKVKSCGPLGGEAAP